MNAIGNVLWVFLGGGLLIAVEYLIGGLILCFSIIGIPFGIQCFKLAGLALLPFGYEIYTREGADGCVSTFMNILWILSGGILLTLSHLLFALLCAVTIIGIPFASQHIKLMSLALVPFGRDIVGAVDER